MIAIYKCLLPEFYCKSSLFVISIFVLPFFGKLTSHKTLEILIRNINYIRIFRTPS